MKLIIFLTLFLLLGAFFIISNQNIKIDGYENLSLFMEQYIQWIDNLINNGKYISGYVVKMEWLPNQGKAYFDSS